MSNPNPTGPSWGYDMTSTNVSGNMWPSTTASANAGASLSNDFASLALQDGQAVSNTGANASGWPSVTGDGTANGSTQGSSDLAAQRPNNLGALGGFGNGSANGSGAAQSGTPGGSQAQSSNLWSTPFMPQTAASGSSGWNAPANFPQAQTDAADPSGGSSWGQQRSGPLRSGWDAGSSGKSSGEVGGMPSPTSGQSDAFGASGNGAAAGQNANALGALSVQTNQGSANGGPATNASNGQMGANSGASLVSKYPRVSYDELDEDTKQLINTHDGWGRVPVDQKSCWNVEAIMEQRNRLAEQLEQRKAEQRAAGAATGAGATAGPGAAAGSESNIWTNEPNTGTNIWEGSRDTATGQSNAFWAGGNNTSRQNSTYGNEQQSWRGRGELANWEDGGAQPPAEAGGMHRSASGSAAPQGGNGSSRGLQHWNSTNEYNASAQRPSGAQASRGGPSGGGSFGFTGSNQSNAGPADFSHNFGQPGSIGVWGEDDGGTGAAQWGANETQGPNNRSWNANGTQRGNAAATGQSNWQASGSQPATPMGGQFGQQGPFAGGAGAGSGAQQRKAGGWTERGNNSSQKNVDDGTNLWSSQRGPTQGTGEWGTTTETGVWDAGAPSGPGSGPKRGGSESTEWDAEQPGSAGRMWGAQESAHGDSHFNEWPGAAAIDQSSGLTGGDSSWGRAPKGNRSQFTQGGQTGGAVGFQSGAAGGVGGNSNYDQSAMSGGGGYQRAKLLSRLTAQGFSREEAQAALIRNNMDYDRTLSELNRQRIQSGMPLGLPPITNQAGAPIRGQLGPGAQHDASMGAAFGGQFDSGLQGDSNAMLLADLMHKQGGSGQNAAAFLNNPSMLNQQQLAALGAVGPNATTLAVQQKLMASGVQVAPGGRGVTQQQQQQQQAGRMPMGNSAQNNIAQQLALAANLPLNTQQNAGSGTGAAAGAGTPPSMAQLQALSQLPPGQFAVVQQYVKLNAQLQHLLQQQRTSAPNLQINSVIEKVQAQLKAYEQQLMQLQAQQRFAAPQGGVQQPQKQQPGVQQPASRLNQWINSDPMGVDMQSAAASNSAFGLADSIPEFVPGKPWPGAQFNRDIESDPNATPASVAQQRLALAARQQQQQQQQVQQAPQSSTTYLLLRNVTQTTDIGVLRQVAAQFGKVINFVPVQQLAICVIAYGSRADAEKARNGLFALTSRGIALEILTDPELARVLQQAANQQTAPRAAPGDRTGTPTGSSDSGLLPNGLLNS